MILTLARTLDVTLAELVDPYMDTARQDSGARIGQTEAPGQRRLTPTKDLSRLGDRESGGVGFFECDQAAGELGKWARLAGRSPQPPEPTSANPETALTGTTLASASAAALAAGPGRLMAP